MSKTSSTFICQQCGYQSPSFLGKCPECGQWNSLVETVGGDLETATSSQLSVEVLRLAQIKGQKFSRISTGFLEFDRVLGGGIVPGSIVLISGDPGIGKSTLLLQTAANIANVTNVIKEPKESKVNKSSGSSVNSATSSSVLYVSGEESAQQIKLRADRVGKIPDDLYIVGETDIERILAASEKVEPSLLIVDSIQTLTSQRLTGSAGSVGQLRECAQSLQRYAKAKHIPIFVVGHITKEGTIAGPKVLEHLVDAVLTLEGDDMYTFRLLRSSKNRFGSTFEVGVFEMGESGLVEVNNPSAIFLAQRLKNRAGSVVCATVAGGRPLLCEVQALTTPTIFGTPARRISGLDFARMQVVIASLSRASKLSLGSLDIYINVAGGLRVVEPACDLACAIAIASAVFDIPVREKLCAFGEVGLLGELRPVGNSKNRISEAKRLGFGDFVDPSRFKTLEEAVSYSLGRKYEKKSIS